jgi:hypothetical protein
MTNEEFLERLPVRVDKRIEATLMPRLMAHFAALELAQASLFIVLHHRNVIPPSDSLTHLRCLRHAIPDGVGTLLTGKNLEHLEMTILSNVPTTEGTPEALRRPFRAIVSDLLAEGEKEGTEASPPEKIFALKETPISPFGYMRLEPHE